MMGDGKAVVTFAILYVAYQVIFSIVVPCVRMNHKSYNFAGMPYHAAVDSAVLAALDTSNSSSSSSANSTDAAAIVRYDLSVNLSFWNRGPVSIWYREIAVAAFYNGSAMLGVPDQMPPPPSGHGRAKNSAEWQAKLKGAVAVYPSVAAELERERAVGMVHVQVRASVSVARKVWPFVPIVYGSYDCWLWFNNPPPAIFDQRTKCFPVK
ncbi:hypothetical protein QOZ80_5BG0456440 [Eleusine coracana subsp. coracana]|nr:hypothetical protein QOZ80_5BG0456440 [Eleusine coracana subsp. coracana]